MTSEHHSGNGALSTAELHAILASEGRRRVVRFFPERDVRVATLDELAEHLVAEGGEFAPKAQASVALHHAHLPKLAETGVLDYDPRTQVTRYRGSARLEALLPSASVA